MKPTLTLASVAALTIAVAAPGPATASARASVTPTIDTVEALSVDLAKARASDERQVALEEIALAQSWLEEARDGLEARRRKRKRRAQAELSLTRASRMLDLAGILIDLDVARRKAEAAEANAIEREKQATATFDHAEEIQQNLESAQEASK